MEIPPSIPASSPESPWLLLDASGLSTRAALWQNSRWLAFRADPAPALTALFTATRAVLADAALALPEVGGFLYVEGPGSVLGLRLAALAIRTWQTEKPRPVQACGALHLAAALILTTTPAPFAICTGTRQGFWHLLEVPHPDLANLAVRTIPDDELARVAVPLYHIPARKTWHPAPAHARPLSADLQDRPQIFSHPGLLRAVAMAIPFTGAHPEYRKWENPAQTPA